MRDINEYKHDFSVRLKMLIKYSGKTKVQICEETYLSKQALLEYGREEHSPRAYSLMLLADSLKCPPIWLFEPSIPISEEELEEWRKSL